MIEVHQNTIESRQKRPEKLEENKKILELEITELTRIVDTFQKKPPPSSHQKCCENPFIDDEMRHLIRELYSLIKFPEMHEDRLCEYFPTVTPAWLPSIHD